MIKSTPLFVGTTVALVLGFAGFQQESTMKTLTPVIFVEEVEPCLGFWVDQLGFNKTMEVPEGDRLGFAAVASGGVEVMYQSRASVANDVPALADGPFSTSGLSLFIRVDDLERVKSALEGAGADLIFPERKTFYGAREIAVWAPCGTAVTFAQFDE